MAVVVVLRALGLGDLLTGVPALRALRRAHRSDRLVLAAPRQFTQLAHWTGAVDDVVDTTGLGRLDWHGPAPDLAVNLHGSGPQSIADLVGTHPGQLLTHQHDDYPDLPGPVWDEGLHEVDRWCRLVEYGGCPADRDDLRLIRPGGDFGAGTVVVHPGAASAARRWPADRFAAVAGHLHRAGHTVVVTGSPAERSLAEEIVESAGLPQSSMVAGDSTVVELAARVAGASLVICGDTGVGHLATAFATPSVLLFGPTPPQLWGPPAEDPRHRVLWHGSTGDPHGRRPDPGLLEISVDEVVAAVEEQLGAAAPLPTGVSTGRSGGSR